MLKPGGTFFATTFLWGIPDEIVNLQVCLCTYTFVCLRVYVCMCVYVPRRDRQSSGLCVYVYICLYTYVCVCIRMYVCICIQTRSSMFGFICPKYTRTHTNTHTHTHTRTHTHTHHRQIWTLPARGGPIASSVSRSLSGLPRSKLN